MPASRAGLVAMQKQVEREGRTHLQTFWVRPEDAEGEAPQRGEMPAASYKDLGMTAGQFASKYAALMASVAAAEQKLKDKVAAKGSKASGPERHALKSAEEKVVILAGISVLDLSKLSPGEVPDADAAMGEAMHFNKMWAAGYAKAQLMPPDQKAKAMASLKSLRGKAEFAAHRAMVALAHAVVKQQVGHLLGDAQAAPKTPAAKLGVQPLPPPPASKLPPAPAKNPVLDVLAKDLGGLAGGMAAGSFAKAAAALDKPDAPAPEKPAPAPAPPPPAAKHAPPPIPQVSGAPKLGAHAKWQDFKGDVGGLIEAMRGSGVGMTGEHGFKYGGLQDDAGGAAGLWNWDRKNQIGHLGLEPSVQAALIKHMAAPPPGPLTFGHGTGGWAFQIMLHEVTHASGNRHDGYGFPGGESLEEGTTEIVSQWYARKLAPSVLGRHYEDEDELMFQVYAGEIRMKGPHTYDGYVRGFAQVAAFVEGRNDPNGGDPSPDGWDDYDATTHVMRWAVKVRTLGHTLGPGMPEEECRTGAMAARYLERHGVGPSHPQYKALHSGMRQAITDAMELGNKFASFGGNGVPGKLTALHAAAKSLFEQHGVKKP